MKMSRNRGKRTEVEDDDRKTLGEGLRKARNQAKGAGMRSGSGVNAVAGPEGEFRTLYEEWRRDTATSSSMRTKASHPAYRCIVAMGGPAIPSILDQLRRRPSHIFWVLHEITGANPVKPESAGKVGEMVEDWLKWGATEGYEGGERTSSGTSRGLQLSDV